MNAHTLTFRNAHTHIQPHDYTTILMASDLGGKTQFKNEAASTNKRKQWKLVTATTI